MNSTVAPVIPVRRDPITPRLSRPRRALLLPSAAALAGFLAAVGLSESGLLRGPAGFALAAVLLVLVPTARTFSRRIAFNGAIALGFIPILWWFPWPAFLGLGHVGFVLGAFVGFVLFRLSMNAEARRALLPEFALVDGLPLAIGAFSAWYFLPFFTHSAGAESVSILTRVFGNDNVAHFDMFEMIRRTLTIGPGWPATIDGSNFVYIWYPQHFHVFSAFVAELWGGGAVGTIDAEAGLFGIGAVSTMLLSIVVLAAAVTSLPALRGRPGLATIVVAACASVLLLGSGSGAFPFGFPSFYLAFVAAVLAVVLALTPAPTSRFELLAIAGAVIVVAHSWSLLTPIAGVAFAWAFVRLPWASYRERAARAIPAGLIVGAVALSVGFALFLVYQATKSVGSPDAVLSIGGGLPATSAVETILIGITLVGVCLASLVPAGRAGARSRFSGPLTLIGLAGATGLVVAAGLIAIQLQRANELSYYQLKFLMAVNIVFAILLVLAIALWAAEATRPPRDLLGRLMAVASVAVLVAAVILYSGVPVAGGGAVTDAKTSAGLRFRADVLAQAALAANPEAVPGVTSRLSSAAQLMAGWPCARPIYLSPRSDAASLADSNQWAMSLSSTWTEAASPINSFLAGYTNAPDVPGEADEIVATLLTGSPERCIILSAESMEALSAASLASNTGRLFTW
jgi:hypothetical protein